MSECTQACGPVFLESTQFCDAHDPIIVAAAKNITLDCTTTQAAVQNIFYLVRDSVKYELGINNDSASDTLRRGYGSCTNKANLLVALLRSRGVPSAFHVMHVQTPDYFGPVCTPEFGRLIRGRSCHIYCSAWVNDKWLNLDSSDDAPLARAIQHLCSQGKIVEFDGERHARIDIDPAHVISDMQELLPSIDAYLSKERRLPATAVTVFNHYLDYLRRHAIWNVSVRGIAEGFFDWLQGEHPDLHQRYVQLADRDAGNLRGPAAALVDESS